MPGVLLVTDYTLEQIPGLRDATPEQQQQALGDAQALYSYLNGNRVVEEADARKWGEQQGIGPDRFNVAMETLESLGKLHKVQGAAPVGPVAPEDLEGKTLPELKELAKKRGLTGYSSMTKPDLVGALS